MPGVYGPPTTCWRWHKRWVEDGTWDRRLDAPEERRLDALARAFGLSTEARAKAELEAFAAIFSSAAAGTPRNPLRTDTTILGRVSMMRAHLIPLADGLTLELEEIYRLEVLDVLDDKKLDEEERTQLDDLAKAFGLSDQATSRTELEAFLSHYSDAVSEGRLTKDADTTLSPIETSVQLQRREQCFLECDAVERKSRVVESYSLGGVRYTEKNLLEDRSGNSALPASKWPRTCPCGQGA